MIGIFSIFQDWLNVQLDKITALKTNLTLGQIWLSQMNEAAKANNVFIQYCMSNPRHALQSLTLSQVTQVNSIIKITHVFVIFFYKLLM